jgi:Domain of unknown function DUF488
MSATVPASGGGSLHDNAGEKSSSSHVWRRGISPPCVNASLLSANSPTCASLVPSMRVFTVGHSTHSLDDLEALLAAHNVERVADVRRVPRSARHAQFRAESLAVELPTRGVDYRHLPALGGWRRPLPDSPNGGWDNDAFRGYADYALTAEFAEALDELQTLARERLTAIMCAEGLWWQCHRRLIADRLVASGWTACHIGPNGALAEHALPPFAEPQADAIVLYPPAQGSLLGPYASA